MKLNIIIKYMYGLLNIITVLILIGENNISTLRVSLIILIVLNFLIIASIGVYLKKFKRTMKETQQIYATAIQEMNGSIWEWCEDTNIVTVSELLYKQLGLENRSITLEEWCEYICIEDKSRVKDYISEFITSKDLVDFKIEYKIKDKVGTIRFLKHIGKARVNEDIYFITGVTEDITEFVKQDRIIKDNSEKYKRVVEGSMDIIFSWNLDTDVIVFDNKITDYLPLKSVESEVAIDYLEWKDRIHEEDKLEYENFVGKFINAKEDIFYEVEYRIKNKQDNYSWIHSKGKKVTYGEGLVYVYGCLTDITDRKEKELKIHFMSYYDDVTGVPNRRYLNSELERVIRESKNKNTKAAMVFIDLDNFKNINDTYGHDMGDAVLTKVCEEFYKVLEKNFILARFGGDEFVIVMEDIVDTNEVRVVLDKILQNLKKAITINGKSIYCALSVGVSIYPDDAEKTDMLLKTADMAMYKAKANGKSRYEFFDVSMLNTVKREYEVEKALRDALDLNEIYMVFQPKIMLNTGRIEGFEALVRWQSKELGFVSPGEFIPIAESSGVINELGKFITEECFKKAKELSDLTTTTFHIAINISEVQLRDDQFINFVREKLVEYELEPKYIQFEITESVIMRSVSSNIEVLLKLKELGFKISLDDFGTGYSSLNYLMRLPIDIVKVDKSFVDGIGVDEKSEYIAESIIDLAHYLNLKVVAEGVETNKQLGYLVKIKCDVVQGYYFSKPEKFEVIKNMILD